MEKVKEITAKAKAAVTGHSDSSHHNTTTGTSTHTGPHQSGLANQADPRVDSDRDGSHNLGGNTHHTTTGGLTGNTHTGNTHTGPHNSGIANQVDPRVDSDRDGSHNFGHNTTHTTGGLTGTHGTSNTTAGPHSSNLANKLDPRVDSDRDGSRNLGAATGNTYGTHTGTHTTGGWTGSTHTGNTHTGPHTSNLANQVDPRVDSDRDGSRNFGAATGNTYGTHNTGGLTGTHGTHNTGGLTGQSTHTGPHTSNLANQVDPRVDSDRDGSRNFGAATGNTYGTHNTGGLTGTHGTHNTGGLTGTHGTTGTSHNTAGPHKSDMANKLDPRVDSDLDGSRNMGLATGQNTTYSNTTGPPDASKHGPTTFAKLSGGVETDIAHDGDPEDHRRRHSLKPADAGTTLDEYSSGTTTH